MKETWKSRRTGGKISKWRDLQADGVRNREVDKGKCRQKERPAVKKGNAGRQREEQTEIGTGRQTDGSADRRNGFQ
jgi:hypothetical protein